MNELAPARPCILAVDDEPLSLDLMGEGLGDAFELHAVHDGRSALQLLEREGERFDLVILDRCMAAPDGLSLLRYIRAEPALARIPVILQTASADLDHVAEGIAAGADHYLTKPYRLAALQALVRAALRRARALAEAEGRSRELAAALALLGEGRFRVRTLDDAAVLASALATLCAEPELVRAGLSELLINAIEHGNLGLGFHRKAELLQAGRWHEELERRLRDPALRHRQATLAVVVEPQEVHFAISDEGEGFDWTACLQMAPARPDCMNGRGIALARRLAFPGLSYQDGGRVALASATPRPRLPG